MTTNTTADLLVEIFIWIGAIAATLFVVLYPILSPGWRRTWIGWALLVSSSGLALLLDLSLVTKLTGGEFLARDPIRVGITAWIAVGATLKVLALAVAKYRHITRGRRES